MTSNQTELTPMMPATAVARSRQEGKVGWLLMWLLGIPIPVLLVLFLVRGCT